MEFSAPPRQLPACDNCYAKKTRCDRKDPCFNCRVAKVSCLRRRPRQVATRTSGSANGQLNAVLERMERLEESLKTTASQTQSADPRARRQSAAASSIVSDAATSASERRQEQAEEWTLSPISDEGISRGIATAAATQPPQPPPPPPPPPPPSQASRKRPADNISESGRQRTAPRIPHPVEEEDQSPQDKVLTSLDLNRYLKPIRSSTANREMDTERQRVLEAAIGLAKRAMVEPELKHDRERRPNFYDTSMYPSAEFLHLILHVQRISMGCTQTSSTSYFLSLFSSMASSSLERMVIALLDGSVHGQKRIQYLICVNHVAYTFLTALDSEQSPEMRAELIVSKRRYRDNIVTAVAHLSTNERPDISLFFALQSSSLLMQDIGKMRMCWKLNTLACQVGSALRGRSMAELGAYGPDDVTAFQTACIRAYVFDTSLSANNYQPACLARMDIDRSVLDTKKPGDAMLDILLSFSEVQEVIILETRKLAAPGKKNQMDTQRLSNLQQRLKDIRALSNQYRSRPIIAHDEYLSFEWETIDFMYYCTMTTIVRLGSLPDDPDMPQNCLENARQGLFTLKHLLDLKHETLDQDRYLSSLGWVVPLYPLRPLYFLFQNIIQTSNSRDLRLLQDIAKGLKEPAESLHSIMEIQQLCTSFLSLYDEFVEKTMYYPAYQDSQQCDTAAASGSGGRFQHSQQLSLDSDPNQDGRRPPSFRPMAPFSRSSGIEPSTAARQATDDFSTDPSAQPAHDLMAMGNNSPLELSFFDQQVNWELFYTHEALDFPINGNFR